MADYRAKVSSLFSGMAGSCTSPPPSASRKRFYPSSDDEADTGRDKKIRIAEYPSTDDQKIEAAYRYMFDKCYELYRKLRVAAFDGEDIPEDGIKAPQFDSLLFWERLLILVTFYFDCQRSSQLDWLPEDDEIIRIKTWSHLSADLCQHLEEHLTKGTCALLEYAGLERGVYRLYDRYVANIPSFKDTKPEILQRFIPFVQRYLQEPGSLLMGVVRNVHGLDELEGFPAATEGSLFSRSIEIVTAFAKQLMSQTQRLLSFGCHDHDIYHQHMAFFANILVDGLGQYITLAEETFWLLIADENISSTILSNLHQASILVDELYDQVGFEKLGQEAADIYENLWIKINVLLDELRETLRDYSTFKAISCKKVRPFLPGKQKLR